MDLARIVGIVGLLLVAGGVIQRQADWRNRLFAVGGIFLFLYSLAQRDPIFAILELLFSSSALYELWRSGRGK